MGNTLKKAGNAALLALTGYEVGQTINNNNNGQTRIEVITVKVPTETTNNSTTVYSIIWPYCILLIAFILVLAEKNTIKKCLRGNVSEGRAYYQQNEQGRPQVQVQIPQNL